MIPGENIDIRNIDALLEEHMGFIIRVTSMITGKYVSADHDDIFSIALSAFCESVEKFNPERGSFLSFARLVIESRVKTFLKKESREEKTESVEALYEQGIELPEREKNSCMEDEIEEYRSELEKFGLTLEKLADESPKHRDTKERGIRIAKRAGEDKETVALTYKKRKLPVRKVAGLAEVTEKIVKRSKTFILGAMLIFANHFTELKRFILEAR